MALQAVETDLSTLAAYQKLENKFLIPIFNNILLVIIDI